ncbi:MAG: 50S ribosomal protein L32e [Candidatus Marsarchaeota archaeon]|nr:50S ribosomal protein L32e [Candidatus Marsarchaeota archaeon]
MNTKKKVRFVVPNLGAKSRKHVKDRWRKQRGMDNHKRVMRKGYGEIPKIGYKNPGSARHLGADGNARVLVHNKAELQTALQAHDVTIILHHALSQRKKLELQKLAEGNGIKVSNRVR